MADTKTFQKGATVRLSGEGADDRYTVEDGGTFGQCDRVRLRPATEYLRVARRDRMDADGCITALACFIEQR